MSKKQKEPQAPKPEPVWAPTHAECLEATKKYIKNGGQIHHLSFTGEFAQIHKENDNAGTD